MPKGWTGGIFGSRPRKEGQTLGQLLKAKQKSKKTKKQWK